MRDKSIYRVEDSALALAAQNARLRDLMAEAWEVLRLPMPDTFLGRKTQEPFPKEPPEA